MRYCYKLRTIERNLVEEFEGVRRSIPAFLSLFKPSPDSASWRHDYGSDEFPELYNEVQVCSTLFDILEEDIQTSSDIDKLMPQRTENALIQHITELNRRALFGHRGKRESGGLYYFSALRSHPKLDACGRPLTEELVRTAAHMLKHEGGNPLLLVCHHSQQLSGVSEYVDIVKVLGDYLMPHGDAWLIDPSGFNLCNLRNRSITDVDVTPHDFPGIRRCLTSYFTFEFPDLSTHCVKIQNLRGSNA